MKSKIGSFDKSNLATLRKELNNNIQKVATKYGIKLSLGNITYSSAKFTVRLTANSDANHNNVDDKVSQAKSNLEVYGNMYGLSEKDYGKVIELSGKTVRLLGLLPKRKKFPILCGEVGTDKMYKLSENYANKFRKSKKKNGKSNSKPKSNSKGSNKFDDWSSKDVRKLARANGLKPKGKSKQSVINWLIKNKIKK